MPSRMILALSLLVVPSLAQIPRGRTPEAPPARPLPRVWTVDAGGGGDFLDIQPAIDAAVEGDAIRVLPGTYGGFVWIAEGLTLFADPGPRPSVQELCVIEAIPQGSTALVRNIAFLWPGEMGPDDTLVTARNCPGTVWFEDCRFDGVPALLDMLAFEDCSNGIVARSEVRGGTSIFAGLFASSAPERVGLLVSDSFVSVYDSLFQGPDGAVLGQGSLVVNQVGGVGARIAGSSFLHAAGSSFVGGPPGLRPGTCSIFSGAMCIPAARGGNGLEVLGSTAQVELLDSTRTAGPGRPALPQNCGSSGSVNCAAGPAGSRSSGSFTTIPLPFRSLAVDGAATAGGTYHLVASGEPDDLVYSVLSLATEGTNVPLLFGVRLTAAPSELVFEGTIAANGRLEKDVPVPLLLGTAPFVGYLQGLFLDAFGAYLGSASGLIVTTGP